MRKTWLASAATVCFGLAVATTYLLLTPVPAHAATGYANCTNGRVTCEAYICACTDNRGCIAQDSAGKQTWIDCSTAKKDGVTEVGTVETQN